MGSLKDLYDVLKDLRGLAKEAKNQPMMDMLVEIQDRFFDLKEEMQGIKERNTELERENKLLHEALENYQNSNLGYNIKNTFVNYNQSNIVLDYTEDLTVYPLGYQIKRKQITTNLEEIFKNISLKMTSPITYIEFNNSFNLLCPGYYVNEKQALKVKAQLLAMDLISTSTNKKDMEVITLTELGKAEMKRLNS